MAQQATDEAVIKVSGALKGVVSLPSFESTVGELKAEVARLLGENSFPLMHRLELLHAAAFQLRGHATSCPQA